MQVYVTAEGDGKEAITRYHVLHSNGHYSLLELDLETGRKNLIRVQMESIGHPIAGDYKYGADTDPAGRLMLHADGSSLFIRKQGKKCVSKHVSRMLSFH